MARRPDSNDADSDDPTERTGTETGGTAQPTDDEQPTNDGHIARKDGLTAGTDGFTAESEQESDAEPSDERSMLLDRRSYVGMLGGAAAAAIGLSASSAAAAEDYEVVELGEGEAFTRSLGSGDTLENVLIDARANNADVHVSADGDGWVIRNVGVRGAIDIGDDSPGGDDASYEGGYNSVFTVDASAGGSGLIENVYLGDGIEPGTDKSGLITATNHEGHIDVRNFNCGGFSTTAFYISGFGREQTGGTMTIENSYFENSAGTAHIRPAGNVTIRNCTITNTNEAVYIPSTFGGLEQAMTSRGIWTSYSGPTTLVENCDIDVREENTCTAPWDYVGPCQANAVWAGEAPIDLVDSEVRGTVGGNINQSNVGSDPDLSLPDGCPSSAENAAGGDGSSGGSGNEDGGTDHSVISISGGSGSNQVNYAVEVSESVEKGDRANPEESIEDTTATGYVIGGTDSFQFLGEVTDFSADGELTVSVDGQTVDPNELASGDSYRTDDQENTEETEDEPVLSREIRISGGSQSNQVDYTFTVSEAVAKGERANSEESVSDATASGYVIGGTDSFDFAGEITAFDATGDLTITVDGSEVDQETLGNDSSGDSGNEQSLPNGVTLSGGSMNQPVEYEFTVSEAVAMGDRANSEESISGTTASGYVVGGTDSFDFAGEITSFSATGDLTITVNGEEVAQEDLGDSSDGSDDGPTLDRELRISGGSQSNQVDYTFTVSEAVAKGERANSEESVSGSTASGYVVGGTDSFDFAGEVTAFDASDAVTLTIDGETVDPAQFDSTDGDDSSEEPTLDREIRISGGSQSNQVNYSFSASEAVAKGERANSEESVSGTSASGYVVGGTDSFDFAGEITSFEADGDLTVTADGEEVDLGQSDDEEPPKLTEEIRISGGSQSNQVNYSFTVSEAVAKGDRANSEESVSGSTASGYVVGGTDSFDFAGEITNFEADGDLTVTVNGSEVDL